jgi:hypothetical protein
MASSLDIVVVTVLKSAPVTLTVKSSVKLNPVTVTVKNSSRPKSTVPISKAFKSV